MKKYYSVLLAGLIFSPLCFCATLPHPQRSEQLLDQVVAIVNSEVITQSQLDAAVNRAKQQMAEHNAPAMDSNTLRKQVLQQLIDRRIQLQIATRNGMKVSDQQVNSAIDHIMQQNHLTMAGIKQKLAQQGYTLDKFRHDIREQILISQLTQQAVGKDTIVTPKEVDQFMKTLPATLATTGQQYDVIDILIPTDPSNPLQLKMATQKANQMLQALKQGKTPAQVGNGNDSDLGWRALSDLPDPFIQPVKNLKLHGIAGPIKAPNGLHLLILQGIRQNQSNGGSAMPSKDQIHAYLYQQKLQAGMKKWLEQLYKNSNIKIMNQDS